MKTTFAITALVANTLAQSGFSVMSVRSGSPIQYLPMNANGQKFWLGSPETSSYCPTDVVTDCPAGTDTVFAGGDGTLGLDVEVPGGQQVYVAPDGTLSFTGAHSDSIPEGSYTTGFTLSPGTSSLGHLGWDQGFVACPTATTGSYQVYGYLDTITYPSGCLGFDALTVNQTGVGAWQYT